MTIFIVKFNQGVAVEIEAKTLSAAKAKATKLREENGSIDIYLKDADGKELAWKNVRRAHWVDFDCSKPIKKEEFTPEALARIQAAKEKKKQAELAEKTAADVKRQVLGRMQADREMQKQVELAKKADVNARNAAKEESQEPPKDGFLSRCIMVEPEKAKRAFVIRFSMLNSSKPHFVTIEASNLVDAMNAAELMQINNGWCKDGMTISSEDLQLIAMYKLGRDGYDWVSPNTQDSLMFALAEEKAAQDGFLSRCVMAEPKKETQEFTIRFTKDGSSYNFMTIEAANLHEATEMASSLQSANGWHNDMAMLAGFNSTLLSVYDYDNTCGWCWREVMKPAKKPEKKSGFAIVDEIPECGEVALSIFDHIKGKNVLLTAPNSNRRIVLEGDIASKVEVSEKAGNSVIHPISNQICDDSYLTTNLAEYRVFEWWAKKNMESVGFIRTKNNNLIIVTEQEAKWLDTEFYPLIKASR
ncbi:MAG: hypothetical protein ACRCWB_11775 [Enterovibrio sp.]